MSKFELCIGILGRTGMEDTKQLELIKQVGFDGYFPCWTEEYDLKALRAAGDSLGLRMQSVHEHTQWVKDRTVACIRAAAECGAPIVVIHPFITFTRNEATAAGIDNYGTIVDAAREAGVKLAIENVEGEAYLDALMDAFKGEKHVGFCWDTGHEMCYNRHRDLLKDYGDRLLCTHINDNLGIKAKDGSLTFHDDLHLLPGDGNICWVRAIGRLKNLPKQNILNFWLKKLCKSTDPGDRLYAQLTTEDYFHLAAQRARQIADLYEKESL